MKVKELIKRLEKLDPNKPIWINYDLCESKIPRIKRAIHEFEIVGEIKKDDYVIMV